MSSEKENVSVRGIAIWTIIGGSILAFFLPLYPRFHVVLEPNVFVAYLSLLSGILGSLCGFIAVMSWMMYQQDKVFWNLVAGLICYNIFFIMFVFAFSYPGMPSSEFLFISSARSQNLTIVLGLVPSGGFMIGEIANRYAQDDQRKKMYIVLSIITCPIISLFLVTSPTEPIPIQEISTGLTLIGFWIVIIYFMISILAIIYFGIKYKKGKYLMQRTIPFVLSLVLISGVPLHYRTSTYQVSNLLILIIVIMAMMIMAYSMIFDFSKNLHSSLSDQVLDRTNELRLAKDESDFYVYIYSHEVGNLLQSLQMYIDLYMDSENPNEIESYKQFHTISENVSRVIQRIRQLADVGLTDEVILTPIDLDISIRKAMDIIEVTLRKHDFDIKISGLENPIQVEADDLIILLFVNLLENAVKYCEKESPIIEIRVKNESDTCMIEFIDKGPMLEENTIDALHEEETQKNQGLGAGLYIVKKLVKLYNGDIEYLREKECNIFRLSFQYFSANQ
ncbi:MAG: putative Histidine kinase [Candidatus Thorarchaeota archaeon]|nr:MAG: putative Histidine kinase [Candidatus Thorarchaeota archaeon]